MAAVRIALGQPENLAAALGYYRAMFSPAQHGDQRDESRARWPSPLRFPCSISTARTMAVCELTSYADPTPFLGPRRRYERVSGAGHFLHLERPDVVGQLIVDFVTEP
jgi:pimeloyl-ACP methyl ester carboxylesterase